MLTEEQMQNYLSPGTFNVYTFTNVNPSDYCTQDLYTFTVDAISYLVTEESLTTSNDIVFLYTITKDVVEVVPVEPTVPVAPTEGDPV
jgi:hypothetical protein